MFLGTFWKVLTKKDILNVYQRGIMSLLLGRNILVLLALQPAITVFFEKSSKELNN